MASPHPPSPYPVAASPQSPFLARLTQLPAVSSRGSTGPVGWQLSSQHYALLNYSFPERLQAPCPRSEPGRATTAQRLKLSGASSRQGPNLRGPLPPLHATCVLKGQWGIKAFTKGNALGMTHRKDPQEGLHGPHPRPLCYACWGSEPWGVGVGHTQPPGSCPAAGPQDAGSSCGPSFGWSACFGHRHVGNSLLLTARSLGSAELSAGLAVPERGNFFRRHLSSTPDGGALGPLGPPLSDKAGTPTGIGRPQASRVWQAQGLATGEGGEVVKAAPGCGLLNSSPTGVSWNSSPFCGSRITLACSAAIRKDEN